MFSNNKANMLFKGFKKAPITEAIENNNMAKFTELIDDCISSAASNIQTFYSRCLEPICQRNNLDMLKVSIEKANEKNVSGIDINIKNLAGVNMLHICAAYGSVECGSFLLENGID